jgi:hypothetical protein
MAESLPTLSDINVYDSLDERAAAEHFLGKDLQQAEAMFADHSVYYLEDLLWMGPGAFCFYVDAAIAYFASPAATGDADGLRSFFGALEFQGKHYPNAIAPARERLMSAVHAILDDFERFGCDGTTDADLPARYGRLHGQLKDS